MTAPVNLKQKRAMQNNHLPAGYRGPRIECVNQQWFYVGHRDESPHVSYLLNHCVYAVRSPDGSFYQCNEDHGAGWTRELRQTWTPSRLAKLHWDQFPSGTRVWPVTVMMPEEKPAPPPQPRNVVWISSKFTGRSNDQRAQVLSWEMSTPNIMPPQQRFKVRMLGDGAELTVPRAAIVACELLDGMNSYQLALTRRPLVRLIVDRSGTGTGQSEQAAVLSLDPLRVRLLGPRLNIDREISRNNVQSIELREEAGDDGAVTSLGFSWDGWRLGLRERPQVVVHLCGGNINSVQANRDDVNVAIIDYDNFPGVDHEKICREAGAKHEIKTTDPTDWHATGTPAAGLQTRSHNQEVPVYHEVNDENEATGTTHWYCSPACRSAAAIDPNALECGAVDCKAGNAVPPLGELCCETCGKSLTNLVAAGQQAVDAGAVAVLEQVTRQLVEEEGGNRKVLPAAEADVSISDQPHQRKYHHVSSAFADGWKVASVPVDYCPRNWFWSHDTMPDGMDIATRSSFRSTGPDSLPPALRAVSYQVRGDYGVLTVDEAGEVLKYEPAEGADPEYRDITKVDVDEYKKHYGEMRDTDILLIGYWDKSGTYEPAEKDAREEHARELADSVNPDLLKVPGWPDVDKIPLSRPLAQIVLDTTMRSGRVSIKELAPKLRHELHDKGPEAKVEALNQLRAWYPPLAAAVLSGKVDRVELVAAPGRFVSYEVKPCRRNSEGYQPDPEYVEVCEESEAEFWTVYGRLENGQAVAISELKSRATAELLTNRLRPPASAVIDPREYAGDTTAAG